MEHYFAYGNWQYNLYNQTGMADWGYNAISNAGSIINNWRTLTDDEWEYMLFTRTTSSGFRFVKARVSNNNGVILLPDSWISTYYLLSNTNNYEVGFDSNIITSSQWSLLEQYGAVFLPTAGVRDETNVFGAGENGVYWTSSVWGLSKAGSILINNVYLGFPSDGDRFMGCSIRLVKDYNR